MNLFLRRLYRERRRVGVAAVVTFLAGLLAGMSDDRIVFGIPFQLAYAVAFLVILTPVLMSIVLIFPAIRTGVDSVTFSLPIISVYLWVLGTDSSFAKVVFLIIAIMFGELILMIYGGSWLDKFLPAKQHVFRSRSKSKLQPEELWPFLVVTPDTVETYGGENTVSMKWVEQGVSYVETEQVDDLTRIEELQTIEQLEPDTQIRVRFQVQSAKEDTLGTSGMMERRFDRTTGGTQLVCTRMFDRTTPMVSFRLWLDDTFGRADDQHILRAEQRSGL